jgi:Cu2+-containing amine oxidase
MYALGALAVGGLLFVLAGVTSESEAQQVKPPGGKPKPPAKTGEIIQEFPVGGEMQTAWKVNWAVASPGNGLVITGAWLKTTPEAEWMKVLEDVRLTEIFVPYNNSTRIYDMGASGGFGLCQHTQADAGPHGKLLNDHVVKEVRDTGLLWKYYHQVKRGQELVLWSTMAAANYNYIMEYSFRCDGSIGCRMGSTGKNFGNHETIGHMHHGCWRIDMDLAGPDHNSVYLVRHREYKATEQKPKDKAGRTQTATEIEEPFNGGVEGYADWKAEEYTKVRVKTSQKKNEQGKVASYDLCPLRPGTPRHYANGDGEKFAQHDFWVTKFDPAQRYYKHLPKYVAKKQKIMDTDVVLWYISPTHHVPRDEDGVVIGENGKATVRGVAQVMWCGFDLRPRNVFDNTPLYQGPGAKE